MIQIKRFIDKVSYIESKQGKDVLLSLADARQLRDELAKLLADLYTAKETSTPEIIQVEISGGTFK